MALLSEENLSDLSAASCCWSADSSMFAASFMTGIVIVWRHAIKTIPDLADSSRGKEGKYSECGETAQSQGKNLSNTQVCINRQYVNVVQSSACAPVICFSPAPFNFLFIMDWPNSIRVVSTRKMSQFSQLAYLLFGDLVSPATLQSWTTFEEWTPSVDFSDDASVIIIGTPNGLLELAVDWPLYSLRDESCSSSPKHSVLYAGMRKPRSSESLRARLARLSHSDHTNSRAQYSVAASDSSSVASETPELLQPITDINKDNDPHLDEGVIENKCGLEVQDPHKHLAAIFPLTQASPLQNRFNAPAPQQMSKNSEEPRRYLTRRHTDSSIKTSKSPHSNDLDDFIDDEPWVYPTWGTWALEDPQLDTIGLPRSLPPQQSHPLIPMVYSIMDFFQSFGSSNGSSE